MARHVEDVRKLFKDFLIGGRSPEAITNDQARPALALQVELKREKPDMIKSISVSLGPEDTKIKIVDGASALA
ncbi:hypothetical protein P3342_003490 [Pyrenophora teres f. teres]|uniref:Uncharacterized protein n=1 Tax=Pyrenophora teres f. teres (strain 0-1) TaxID=861557 RepID=E3S197_PYRTT|nr:hypothetical protein PTT_15963 [Pyrenophora teres f. teres 0-1]KAK1915680.1 hypothetical protein P3342_003490 [Pyrenophora teres f. teres]